MPDRKNMWMVRAGVGASLFDEFKENGVVAIGWREIGDLTNVTSREAIKDLVRRVYPDYKEGRIRIWANQIIRFRFEFKINDYVITYNPERRIYMIGKIIGDYEYYDADENSPFKEYPHIRRVVWEHEISRDRLSASTKNTLGSISTIFKLPEESKKEILNLLRGREEPEDISGEEAELDTIRDDIMAKATEFIKDKILKLTWEEMQELVAGLLRGMGYKTVVSPRGPDRGCDIRASPDGLGLEDPRIIVQVKHRSSQVTSEEVRAFLGGLRKGDKGLYVSIGGFTKDAKYEAERSQYPITLVDLDMLVRLIVQYYDNFDSDTKALIPLIKIYWPL